MTTTTTLMTAEDLLLMPDDGRKLELVRGELHVMAPVNFEHLEFVGWLQFKIGGFVYANSLGIIGPEGGFVLDRRPDIVLAPDLAFVRADRLPPMADRTSYAEMSPDLAIEVLSPSNRAQEMLDKVLLYLEAGTRLVWIFDPNREAVTVHTPDRVARTLLVGDTLDGGDVLPGFSLPVAELFDRPGQPPRGA
ncbi:MAG: Uma2 family endonuclease [Chloroflexia bacterium]|nr:Uma2 family endonuclease [Chloroflexia bacterium]